MDLTPFQLAALLLAAAAVTAWMAAVVVGILRQRPAPPVLTAADVEDAIAGCIGLTREAAGG